MTGGNALIHKQVMIDKGKGCFRVRYWVFEF